MELVSVIVPAYNRGHTIDLTLRSVYENTHRPIQVVVVDDGSTDETADVVRNMIVQIDDPTFNIVLHCQENAGAPAARNTGLAEATGRYVMFLDSDDTITENKIADQVGLLQENCADVCVSDFTVFYPQTLNREPEYRSNANPLAKVIKGGSVGCATSLIDVRLAKSISWTEELKNFQDIDYFVKVILNAKRLIHYPVSTYNYFIYNADSITQSETIKKKSNPYKVRLRSLLHDGLLNTDYNKSLISRLRFAVAGLWLSAQSVYHS